MAAPRPIIHGRDHAPGGADPIPGWPTGDGGGIQFDTYPQSGGYLYADTTGSGPNGYGIRLQSGGGYGILIENQDTSLGPYTLANYSSDGEMNVYSDLTNINIFSGDGVIVQAQGNGGVIVQADGSGDLQVHHTGTGGNIDMQADEGAIEVSANGGHLILFSADPDSFGKIYLQAATLNIGGYGGVGNGMDVVTVLLKDGGIFKVQDQSGFDLFQVREDGSVHIKSGTSIVADL